jgi:uncharacterized phage protein gp47/JayE
LPTRLDLYATGRDYVLQRATKIDPGQVDISGSDVNIFVGSNSVVADKVVKQLGYSIARQYLDGANGDDLDRLAFDRYGLLRKGASAALGTISCTRATSTAGAGTIPVGTKLTTLTGVEYITTQAISFGASSLGPITGNVRAVQAGKATQVGINMITRFSSPGALFDSTIQVTNTATTAGGEDVENDDTFRARIRAFWNTARRGILAAIVFGALTVPGVVSAQAIEVVTTNAQPARIVQLYIADSSGVASTALAAQVSQALLDYRAAGIAVLISTSIPQIVALAFALSFNTGVDTVSLTTAIQAAIVNYVNTLPVNGTLMLSGIYTVLQRFASNGLVVNQSSIVSPTGDVVPAIGQTIRTTLSNVTFM